MQKSIRSNLVDNTPASDACATRTDAESQWFAHSGKLEDLSDWQPLQEHLTAVANLASHRAKAFGAEDWAFLVGLLHDLGKYTQEFQARLHGDSTRADHATAGAKEVMKHFVSLYGDSPQVKACAKLLAFAIAGHHAGLANGEDEGQERSTLKQRLAKDIPALDAVWQQEISLPQQSEIPSLKAHTNPEKYANFRWVFLTRMLFSCLIDADRIDTENYTRRLDGKRPLESDYPIISSLQTQLNQHLQRLAEGAKPTEVNVLRQYILQHARQVAIQSRESGLYSLTVPTGGGKTLTSLAFGLDHAVKHRLRRVIYVIPFTSIIEQTAEVFRSALGEFKDAVLEHHSAFDRDRLPEEIKQQSKPRQADYRDKLRLAMESWDAPVVVTTAVQFFESLFSDRPSQCRKLHNIAGSVIVLDEAQTLPLKLLRPIMATIDELALNYDCSVVLCTATQPALKDSDEFHNGFKAVQEIAPNPPDLFERLRRTQVKSLGEQDDDDLVAHLRRHIQVLMIVNNRRHARELFNAIAEEDGAYHLTTAMCAEHRSQKLKEIRQRLQNGQACRLIATSLIEAGVDVDFPTVYRAEAGLDSIAQAAGRCNRERVSYDVITPSAARGILEAIHWKPAIRWQVDPDAGNMPRLDPDSSRGLVTDVCLKRKIRNFIELTESDKAGYDIYVKEKSVLNLQNKKSYEALGIKSESKKLPKDKNEAAKITAWMCKNFFDVRTFGAVMTTDVNSGQVRGPVQLAFAKSEDPIVPLEVSITRMAVTTEKEAEAQSGDNRTMGRKHIVPYGLYRMHGFISAHLAKKLEHNELDGAGFSDDDLNKLWQALEHMFEHDRSAARGEMVARHLVVFKHATALGNAPAHELFERVTVDRVSGEKGSPAQAFADYAVKLDGQMLKGFKHVVDVS